MRSFVLLSQVLLLTCSMAMALQQPQKQPEPEKAVAPAVQVAQPEAPKVAEPVPVPKINANDYSNSLQLVSPNGKHKIMLLAANDGAGIWVEGEPGSGRCGQYVGFKSQGPAMGVWAPKAQFMSAALAAYAPGGGELQLCPLNGPPRFANANRLEEIQNVIYPPAKPKGEPVEPVPLRE